MALTIHDPGHVGLHRGIRAAVALPLSMAITLSWLDDGTGAVFAIFGTVGLLINADFAGTTVQRLSSYLATGAVGTVALWLGWTVSPTTVAPVVVTVLVAFTLSFATLLRGPVAVGTPAVLLVYVVAVSIESTPVNLRSYLAGWWVSVAVCTITALVLLPRNRQAHTRAALAHVFTAAARASEALWIDGDRDRARDRLAEFERSVDDLDERYGGQPFRTLGLTARDQATHLLVAMVNSTRLLLLGPTLQPLSTDEDDPVRRTGLARCVVQALDDLAAAMQDPTRVPSAAALDEARGRLAAAMEQWVLQHTAAGASPTAVSARIADDHELRMAGLIAEQMTQVARVALGAPVEELERRPPVPMLTRWTIIRSQLDVRSPWLRNALRSAVGLGLGVLVIQLTGVEKGFWVLLGIISILRFDAVGTRRFAAQAVAGTIAGVLIASLVLLSAGSHEWVLWLLLPLAVFLAAWSAVAISYPVGQAAFSALILIALGIINWPPQPSLGLVRIEDIALGAAVALVVGLLMWPRGAVGYLRQELAHALRLGTTYLSTAMDSLIRPAEPGSIEAARWAAVLSTQRAAETYDVALMQRGPAEDLRPWTGVTVSTYLVLATARVIADFDPSEPVISTHPELTEALSLARERSAEHWRAVADGVESDVPSEETHPAADPPYPVLPGITGPDDARALVVTVWVVDWVRHLNRITGGRPPVEGQLA